MLFKRLNFENLVAINSQFQLAFNSSWWISNPCLDTLLFICRQRALEWIAYPVFRKHPPFLQNEHGYVKGYVAWCLNSTWQLLVHRTLK